MNYGKQCSIYMYTDENEAITAITIFKYEKSKAGEASEAIENVYMAFFGAPGFRYLTKLASGASATMKIMGLTIFWHSDSSDLMELVLQRNNSFSNYYSNPFINTIY